MLSPDMRFLHFLPPVLLVSCLMVLSWDSVRAAKPESLELKQNGDIIISCEGLPPLQMHTEVTDVSTGGWKQAKHSGDFLPSSGIDVERVGNYVFPDGTEIAHTVKAKIQDSSVVMAASWAPPGPAIGFSRVDLWLPQEIAQDVVITVGLTKIFPLEEGDHPRPIKNTDPIVFKSKSTGGFLFELSGDYLGIIPAFLADKPEAGLTIRLATVPDDHHSTIGDVTQANWTMAFKP